MPTSVQLLGNPACIDISRLCFWRVPPLCITMAIAEGGVQGVSPLWSAAERCPEERDCRNLEHHGRPYKLRAIHVHLHINELGGTGQHLAATGIWEEKGTCGSACAVLRTAESAMRPVAGERLAMPARAMRCSTALLAATMPTPCQAPHCTLVTGSPAGRHACLRLLKPVL